MLLAKELVGYLSRQLVKRLAPKSIDAVNPAGTAELIQKIITDELEIEDKLNEEVRELLGQYSDYMRQESISYQEMFRKIKNQMVQKRKIIRASGRDTNDNMKLSRDKITDLSHKILSALKKSREVRVKKAENDIRLDIVAGFTELLLTEEKVDRDARAKVRSIKRDIPEGSEEFELLQKRYYAEELKKLGIELNS
ncbi:MAG: DUF507 family protein [Bryobacteraceae bacterium]|nr:DUF507 family protein [Bryobacteraceae bacterium]